MTVSSKPPFAGEVRRVRLGEIASVKAGNVAPKKSCFSEVGTPFIRAGSLSRLVAGEDSRFLERIDKATADGLGLQLFPKGTILFAKSGMSCMTGNVYVLQEACYVVSHLACVTVNNPELSCYLKHYFKRNKPSILVENPSFPSIRLSKIVDMELALPSPLQVARQAASLDNIDRVIGVCSLQLSLLDDLVKSRFVEMFGDPVENPMGWEVSTINETSTIYGDGPFGSNLKSADYVDRGVRVIRLGNIGQGVFLDDDRSYVSWEKFETLRKYECLPGEVVIATLGEPLLRACLVPDFGAPSIHKADCMYYAPDKERVLPVFAMCAINHPTMLQRAMLDMHGQTRNRINSTQVGKLPMVIPPLSLQREFASFAAEVAKSQVAVRQQIEKLQTLYDSLAQDYFG